MKRYLPLILTLILLLQTNVLGETQESIFIDFEEGKGNMLTQNAVVCEDEDDGNHSLVLSPGGEKAYMHKTFRNMRGRLVAGFKLKLTGGTEGDFCLVSDKGEILRVLTFADSKLTCAANVVGDYDENNEIKVISYINCKDREIIFDIDGKKSKKFIFNELSSGISAFAAECTGEGEAMFDNMYCYIGDKPVSEYDMMSVEQKAMMRTKGTAVYSVYGGAILNGKTGKASDGARIIDKTVYLPLRNTIEAVGGTVEWADGLTTVINKGVSYTVDKNTSRLVDSSLYLAKDTYSSLFGLSVYNDICGVCMVSQSDSFIKSSNERELYEALIKRLTGNTLLIQDGGRYSLTPLDFDRFYMEPITVSSVWASSESQPELGYVKENVCDGDLVSRWSSDENGAELILDLGETQELDAVALAFMNGTVRRAYFEIYTSNDNKNWQLQIPRSETSGKTDLREVYPVNTTARYVKYKGYGTSSSVWNSVTEFNVLKIRQEYICREG